MARHKSEVSNVNSSTLSNSENYSSLLQAFSETHEEANRLTLSNNRLKGINNWLEGKVKELQDELLTLKTDFDHLEMISKFAAFNDLLFASQLICEGCVVLKNKANYFIKTASRLSMGTVNLNAILGSQNCVFEKLALDISVISKENKRSSTVSLNIIKTSLHPLSLLFIV